MRQFWKKYYLFSPFCFEMSATGTIVPVTIKSFNLRPVFVNIFFLTPFLSLSLGAYGSTNTILSFKFPSEVVGKMMRYIRMGGGGVGRTFISKAHDRSAAVGYLALPPGKKTHRPSSVPRRGFCFQFDFSNTRLYTMLCTFQHPRPRHPAATASVKETAELLFVIASPATVCLKRLIWSELHLRSNNMRHSV